MERMTKDMNQSGKNRQAITTNNSAYTRTKIKASISPAAFLGNQRRFPKKRAVSMGRLEVPNPLREATQQRSADVNLQRSRSSNSLTGPSESSKSSSSSSGLVDIPRFSSDSLLKHPCKWEAVEIRYMERDKRKLLKSDSDASGRSVAGQQTPVVVTVKGPPGWAGEESGSCIAGNGARKEQSEPGQEPEVKKQTVVVEKLCVRNLLNTIREQCGDLSTSRLSEYRPSRPVEPHPQLSASSLCSPQGFSLYPPLPLAEEERENLRLESRMDSLDSRGIPGIWADAPLENSVEGYGRVDTFICEAPPVKSKERKQVGESRSPEKYCECCCWCSDDVDPLVTRGLPRPQAEPAVLVSSLGKPSYCSTSPRAGTHSRNQSTQLDSNMCLCSGTSCRQDQGDPSDNLDTIVICPKKQQTSTAGTHFTGDPASLCARWRGNGVETDTRQESRHLPKDSQEEESSFVENQESMSSSDPTSSSILSQQEINCYKEIALRILLDRKKIEQNCAGRAHLMGQRQRAGIAGEKQKPTNATTKKSRASIKAHGGLSRPRNRGRKLKISEPPRSEQPANEGSILSASRIKEQIEKHKRRMYESPQATSLAAKQPPKKPKPRTAMSTVSKTGQAYKTARVGSGSSQGSNGSARKSKSGTNKACPKEKVRHRNDSVPPTQMKARLMSPLSRTLFNAMIKQEPEAFAAKRLLINPTKGITARVKSQRDLKAHDYSKNILMYDEFHEMMLRAAKKRDVSNASPKEFVKEQRMNPPAPKTVGVKQEQQPHSCLRTPLETTPNKQTKLSKSVKIQSQAPVMTPLVESRARAKSWLDPARPQINASCLSKSNLKSPPVNTPAVESKEQHRCAALCHKHSLQQQQRQKKQAEQQRQHQHQQQTQLPNKQQQKQRSEYNQHHKQYKQYQQQQQPNCPSTEVLPPNRSVLREAMNNLNTMACDEKSLGYSEMLQGILRSPTARATQALGLLQQNPPSVCPITNVINEMTVEQIIRCYQELFSELNNHVGSQNVQPLPPTSNTACVKGEPPVSGAAVLPSTSPAPARAGLPAKITATRKSLHSSFIGHIHRPCNVEEKRHQTRSASVTPECARNLPRFRRQTQSSLNKIASPSPSSSKPTSPAPRGKPRSQTTSSERVCSVEKAGLLVNEMFSFDKKAIKPDITEATNVRKNDSESTDISAIVSNSHPRASKDPLVTTWSERVNCIETSKTHLSTSALSKCGKNMTNTTCQELMQSCHKNADSIENSSGSKSDNLRVHQAVSKFDHILRNFKQRNADVKLSDQPACSANFVPCVIDKDDKSKAEHNCSDPNTVVQHSAPEEGPTINDTFHGKTKIVASVSQPSIDTAKIWLSLSDKRVPPAPGKLRGLSETALHPTSAKKPPVPVTKKVSGTTFPRPQRSFENRCSRMGQVRTASGKAKLDSREAQANERKPCISGGGSESLTTQVRKQRRLGSSNVIEKNKNVTELGKATAPPEIKTTGNDYQDGRFEQQESYVEHYPFYAEIINEAHIPLDDVPLLEQEWTTRQSRRILAGASASDSRLLKGKKQIQTSCLANANVQDSTDLVPPVRLPRKQTEVTCDVNSHLTPANHKGPFSPATKANFEELSIKSEPSEEVRESRSTLDERFRTKYLKVDENEQPQVTAIQSCGAITRLASQSECSALSDDYISLTPRRKPPVFVGTRALPPPLPKPRRRRIQKQTSVAAETDSPEESIAETTGSSEAGGKSTAFNQKRLSRRSDHQSSHRSNIGPPHDNDATSVAGENAGKVLQDRTVAKTCEMVMSQPPTSDQAEKIVPADVTTADLREPSSEDSSPESKREELSQALESPSSSPHSSWVLSCSWQSEGKRKDEIRKAKTLCQDTLVKIHKESAPGKMLPFEQRIISNEEDSESFRLPEKNQINEERHPDIHTAGPSSDSWSSQFMNCLAKEGRYQSGVSGDGKLLTTEDSKIQNNYPIDKIACEEKSKDASFLPQRAFLGSFSKQISGTSEAVQAFRCPRDLFTENSNSICRKVSLTGSKRHITEIQRIGSSTTNTAPADIGSSGKVGSFTYESGARGSLLSSGSEATMLKDRDNYYFPNIQTKLEGLNGPYDKRSALGARQEHYCAASSSSSSSASKAFSTPDVPVYVLDDSQETCHPQSRETGTFPVRDQQFTRTTDCSDLNKQLSGSATYTLPSVGDPFVKSEESIESDTHSSNTLSILQDYYLKKLRRHPFCDGCSTMSGSESHRLVPRAQRVSNSSVSTRSLILLNKTATTSSTSSTEDAIVAAEAMTIEPSDSVSAQHQMSVELILGASPPSSRCTATTIRTNIARPSPGREKVAITQEKEVDLKKPIRSAAQVSYPSGQGQEKTRDQILDHKSVPDVQIYPPDHAHASRHEGHAVAQVRVTFKPELETRVAIDKIESPSPTDYDRSFPQNSRKNASRSDLLAIPHSSETNCGSVGAQENIKWQVRTVRKVHGSQCSEDKGKHLSLKRGGTYEKPKTDGYKANNEGTRAFDDPKSIHHSNLCHSERSFNGENNRGVENLETGVRDTIVAVSVFTNGEKTGLEGENGDVSPKKKLSRDKSAALGYIERKVWENLELFMESVKNGAVSVGSSCYGFIPKMKIAPLPEFGSYSAPPLFANLTWLLSPPSNKGMSGTQQDNIYKSGQSYRQYTDTTSSISPQDQLVARRARSAESLVSIPSQKPIHYHMPLQNGKPMHGGMRYHFARPECQTNALPMIPKQGIMNKSKLKADEKAVKFTKVSPERSSLFTPILSDKPSPALKNEVTNRLCKPGPQVYENQFGATTSPRHAPMMFFPNASSMLPTDLHLGHLMHLNDQAFYSHLSASSPPQQKHSMSKSTRSSPCGITFQAERTSPVQAPMMKSPLQSILSNPFKFNHLQQSPLTKATSSPQNGSNLPDSADLTQTNFVLTDEDINFLLERSGKEKELEKEELSELFSEVSKCPTPSENQNLMLFSDETTPPSLEGFDDEIQDEKSNACPDRIAGTNVKFGQGLAPHSEPNSSSIESLLLLISPKAAVHPKRSERQHHRFGKKSCILTYPPKQDDSGSQKDVDDGTTGLESPASNDCTQCISYTRYVNSNECVVCSTFRTSKCNDLPDGQGRHSVTPQPLQTTKLTVNEKEGCEEVTNPVETKTANEAPKVSSKSSIMDPWQKLIQTLCECRDNKDEALDTQKESVSVWGVVNLLTSKIIDFVKLLNAASRNSNRYASRANKPRKRRGFVCHRRFATRKRKLHSDLQRNTFSFSPEKSKTRGRSDAHCSSSCAMKTNRKEESCSSTKSSLSLKRHAKKLRDAVCQCESMIALLRQPDSGCDQHSKVGGWDQSEENASKNVSLNRHSNSQIRASPKEPSETNAKRRGAGHHCQTLAVSQTYRAQTLQSHHARRPSDSFGEMNSPEERYQGDDINVKVYDKGLNVQCIQQRYKFERSSKRNATPAHATGTMSSKGKSEFSPNVCEANKKHRRANMSETKKAKTKSSNEIQGVVNDSDGALTSPLSSNISSTFGLASSHSLNSDGWSDESEKKKSYFTTGLSSNISTEKTSSSFQEDIDNTANSSSFLKGSGSMSKPVNNCSPTCQEKRLSFFEKSHNLDTNSAEENNFVEQEASASKTESCFKTREHKTPQTILEVPCTIPNIKAPSIDRIGPNDPRHQSCAPEVLAQLVYDFMYPNVSPSIRPWSPVVAKLRIVVDKDISSESESLECVNPGAPSIVTNAHFSDSREEGCEDRIAKTIEKVIAREESEEITQVKTRGYRALEILQGLEVEGEVCSGEPVSSSDQPFIHSHGRSRDNDQMLGGGVNIVLLPSIAEGATVLGDYSEMNLNAPIATSFQDGYGICTNTESTTFRESVPGIDGHEKPLLGQNVFLSFGNRLESPEEFNTFCYPNNVVIFDENCAASEDGHFIHPDDTVCFCSGIGNGSPRETVTILEYPESLPLRELNGKFSKRFMYPFWSVSGGYNRRHKSQPSSPQHRRKKHAFSKDHLKRQRPHHTAPSHLKDFSPPHLRCRSHGQRKATSPQCRCRMRPPAAAGKQTLSNAPGRGVTRRSDRKKRGNAAMSRESCASHATFKYPRRRTFVFGEPSPFSESLSERDDEEFPMLTSPVAKPRPLLDDYYDDFDLDTYDDLGSFFTEMQDTTTTTTTTTATKRCWDVRSDKCDKRDFESCPLSFTRTSTDFINEVNLAQWTMLSSSSSTDHRPPMVQVHAYVDNSTQVQSSLAVPTPKCNAPKFEELKEANAKGQQIDKSIQASVEDTSTLLNSCKPKVRVADPTPLTFEDQVQDFEAVQLPHLADALTSSALNDFMRLSLTSFVENLVTTKLKESHIAESQKATEVEECTTKENNESCSQVEGELITPEGEVVLKHPRPGMHGNEANLNKTGSNCAQAWQDNTTQTQNFTVIESKSSRIVCAVASQDKIAVTLSQQCDRTHISSSLEKTGMLSPTQPPLENDKAARKSTDGAIGISREFIEPKEVIPESRVTSFASQNNGNSMDHIHEHPCRAFKHGVTQIEQSVPDSECQQTRRLALKIAHSVDAPKNTESHPPQVNIVVQQAVQYQPNDTNAVLQPYVTSAREGCAETTTYPEGICLTDFGTTHFELNKEEISNESEENPPPPKRNDATDLSNTGSSKTSCPRSPDRFAVLGNSRSAKSSPKRDSICDVTAVSSSSSSQVDYGGLKYVLSRESKTLWKQLTFMESSYESCEQCKRQYKWTTGKSLSPRWCFSPPDKKSRHKRARGHNNPCRLHGSSGATDNKDQTFKLTEGFTNTQEEKQKNLTLQNAGLKLKGKIGEKTTRINEGKTCNGDFTTKTSTANSQKKTLEVANGVTKSINVDKTVDKQETCPGAMAASSNVTEVSSTDMGQVFANSGVQSKRKRSLPLAKDGGPPTKRASQSSCRSTGQRENSFCQNAATKPRRVGSRYFGFPASRERVIGGAYRGAGSLKGGKTAKMVRLFEGSSSSSTRTPSSGVNDSQPGSSDAGSSSPNAGFSGRSMSNNASCDNTSSSFSSHSCRLDVDWSILSSKARLNMCARKNPVTFAFKPGVAKEKNSAINYLRREMRFDSMYNHPECTTGAFDRPRPKKPFGKEEVFGRKQIHPFKNDQTSSGYSRDRLSMSKALKIKHVSSPPPVNRKHDPKYNLLNQSNMKMPKVPPQDKCKREDKNQRRVSPCCHSPVTGVSLPVPHNSRTDCRLVPGCGFEGRQSSPDADVWIKTLANILCEMRNTFPDEKTAGPPKTPIAEKLAFGATSPIGVETSTGIAKSYNTYSKNDLTAMRVSMINKTDTTSPSRECKVMRYNHGELGEKNCTNGGISNNIPVGSEKGGHSESDLAARKVRETNLRQKTSSMKVIKMKDQVMSHNRNPESDVCEDWLLDIRRRNINLSKVLKSHAQLKRKKQLVGSPASSKKSRHDVHATNLNSSHVVAQHQSRIAKIDSDVPLKDGRKSHSSLIECGSHRDVHYNTDVFREEHRAQEVAYIRNSDVKAPNDFSILDKNNYSMAARLSLSKSIPGQTRKCKTNWECLNYISVDNRSLGSDSQHRGPIRSEYVRATEEKGLASSSDIRRRASLTDLIQQRGGQLLLDNTSTCLNKATANNLHCANDSTQLQANNDASGVQTKTAKNHHSKNTTNLNNLHSLYPIECSINKKYTEKKQSFNMKQEISPKNNSPTKCNVTMKQQKGTLCLTEEVNLGKTKGPNNLRVDEGEECPATLLRDTAQRNSGQKQISIPHISDSYVYTESSACQQSHADIIQTANYPGKQTTCVTITHPHQVVQPRINATEENIPSPKAHLQPGLETTTDVTSELKPGGNVAQANNDATLSENKSIDAFAPQFPAQLCSKEAETKVQGCSTPEFLGYSIEIAATSPGVSENITSRGKSATRDLLSTKPPPPLASSKGTKHRRINWAKLNRNMTALLRGSKHCGSSSPATTSNAGDDPNKEESKPTDAPANVTPDSMPCTSGRGFSENAYGNRHSQLSELSNGSRQRRTTQYVPRTENAPADRNVDMVKGAPHGSFDSPNSKESLSLPAFNTNELERTKRKFGIKSILSFRKRSSSREKGTL